jgi:hypothetical protein
MNEHQFTWTNSNHIKIEHVNSQQYDALHHQPIRCSATAIHGDGGGGATIHIKTTGQGAIIC